MPSGAILEGVKFEIMLRRNVGLLFEYEGDQDEIEKVRVFFNGVEAFKCTYYHACSKDALNAYERLVDCGMTEWLKSIKERLSECGESSDELKHMMIYFDSGPCYEFICTGFDVNSRGESE